jgi:hypothetical protein
VEQRWSGGGGVPETRKRGEDLGGMTTWVGSTWETTLAGRAGRLETAGGPSARAP